jgi:hypothetical protein
MPPNAASTSRTAPTNTGPTAANFFTEARRRRLRIEPSRDFSVGGSVRVKLGKGMAMICTVPP